jgi:transposase
MVQRRKFSKEFKLEAVNLVLGRGVSIAQAARDLDLNENLLSRWVREFRQGEQQAFPGHGIQKPDDAEVTRLKREVAQLKMERDILKKAAAFFAKESM